MIPPQIKDHKGSFGKLTWNSKHNKKQFHGTIIEINADTIIFRYSDDHEIPVPIAAIIDFEPIKLKT
ncbi:hypothetical protein KAR91_46260 [Candidatus Pacearchaeota archaeon]|nr:hypothetical protein [Candidatus Pacearchaeota archaeon]